MNRLPCVVLAGALANFALPAQCQFTTATAQSIGLGCNAASTGGCAIPSIPTTLGTTLDPATCTLTIEVIAFEGCGATIPLRALALGLQPATVPVPAFGPGCALHVAPDVLLAATAGPFALPLPPNVTFATIYVQGFALSLDPSGALIPTLSDGVEITLQ
jgi:hypothetical protein